MPTYPTAPTTHADRTRPVHDRFVGLSRVDLIGIRDLCKLFTCRNNATPDTLQFEHFFRPKNYNAVEEARAA
ncbi:hypothetical protein DPMN_078364, partial [Dreissena polymorpha]